MNLADQINELLDDHVEIYYAQLSGPTQRALAAAYIRENEDIIYDLFANVHETSFAEHFAALLEGQGFNRVAFVQDMLYALQNAPDFETLIDGEIDHQVYMRRKDYERDVSRAEYLEER